MFILLIFFFICYLSITELTLLIWRVSKILVIWLFKNSVLENTWIDIFGLDVSDLYSFCGVVFVGFFIFLLLWWFLRCWQSDWWMWCKSIMDCCGSFCFITLELRENRFEILSTSSPLTIAFDGGHFFFLCCEVFHILLFPFS